MLQAPFDFINLVYEKDFIQNMALFLILYTCSFITPRTIIRYGYVLHLCNERMQE